MEKNDSRHTTKLNRKIRIFTLIGLFLSLMLLSAVGSMFLIDIEDVIYAKGRITSELSFDLISHVDGRVKKLNYDEGDDVKEGAVVAEIDPLPYEEHLVSLLSELREFEAELNVRKAELAALKSNPLPKELWYAETNVKECREKATRTSSRLVRFLKLRQSNAISQKDFEDTEIENIKVQAELSRALENLDKVKSGLGERNIEKAQRDIDLVQSKIDGRRSLIDLVRRQIADCKIIAPSGGRLVSLPCKYTRYVEKGKLALKLSAGGVIKGLAYVDERVIRKVRQGQSVRISSGVFNRLEFGNFQGTVKRVHDTPEERMGINGMTQYPVEITIDPQGRPLKLGSSADFAIVTGKEPVIYSIIGISRDDFTGEATPPPDQL